MRFIPAILALLATIAALFLLSEKRRLESESQRLQVEGEFLRGELGEARQREAQLTKELARATVDLSAAMKREEVVTDTLATQVDELSSKRENLRRERLAGVEVMPAGLRQALSDLNDCLRVDGYAEFRFHRATMIRDAELQGAEFIEHHRGSLKSVSYVAGKLRFELNRETGSLSMTLQEGSMTSELGVVDFPEDGFPIVLNEVDGPMWESRLAYLVNAVGEYPEEVVAASKPGLDPVTKSVWLERVELLLASANTDLRFRLQEFHDLREGRFVDALLLAYEDGRRLAMSAEAKSLQVLVDREAGSVSLLLRGGVLRKVGGESRISTSGYRILLPDVSVEECLDLMLGMVGEG